MLFIQHASGMSIYTKVSTSQLKDFLADYAIGALNTYAGVAEGIENTTYFVDTERANQTGRYVLTLFERQNFDDLPYFIAVMRHLLKSRLPCPQPVPDKKGRYLKTLCRRPAVFSTFLLGKSIDVVNVAQCAQVGSHLAKLHLALNDFEYHRASDRGLDWCSTQTEQITPLLNADTTQLLADELAYQKASALNTADDLPTGVIHADLFRDNCLFDGDKLTGIIDFYYACDGAFIYDLAIVINDWSRLDDSTLDIDKVRAIVNAYRQHRPLEAIEVNVLCDALRLAALRFWISRLTDTYCPRDGHTTHIKDPDVFQNLLTYHRTTPLNI